MLNSYYFGNQVLPLLKINKKEKAEIGKNEREKSRENVKSGKRPKKRPLVRDCGKGGNFVVWQQTNGDFSPILIIISNVEVYLKKKRIFFLLWLMFETIWTKEDISFIL